MTESVTVLMTAYNSCRYLAAAVDSVLAQTYPNFELIIIDDASSDDTYRMAQGYALRDPRVKAIHSPINVGAGAALNLGLEAARGDFITRQDSDDCADPDRLSEQVRFLNETPAVGAVGANVIYIDPSGVEIERSGFPTDNDEIQAQLLDTMCFCGPTVMVRRQAFEAAGYHFTADLATAEDYDLCLRLAEVTRLANLARPLYHYRRHPGSVSLSKRQYQMLNKARSVEAAVKRRFGSQPPQVAVELVGRDYFRAAVLGAFNGDPQRSQRCLEKAQQFYPDILSSAAIDVIIRYLPKTGLAPALEYLDGVFKTLLPPNRGLDRYHRRLRAQVYMREVFRMEDSPWANGERARLAWQGVRWNPGWVLNRGVLSILIKGMLRD